MIISHKKQRCFWKIPRTGSSNIEMVLRLTAGLDLSQDIVAETHFYPASANFDSMPDAPSGTAGTRRAHITPQTALDNGLLTPSEFNVYTHYCMVRNPIDRFISTYHLTMPKYEWDITKIIAEVIVPNPENAVWRKQSEYLTTGNIIALPFSDYVNSANTIFAAFGAPIPDQLPNVSRSHIRYESFIKQTATAANIQEISAYYADDMVLDY
jgi:hypothetical protein